MSCRSQRRLGKETDAGGINAELEKTLDLYAKSETGPEDTEDDESEESGSTDEETRARRRAQRREEKRKAKEQAWIARLRKEGEHRRMQSYQRSLSNARADDEASMDVDGDLGHPPRLADLDSPGGR